MDVSIITIGNSKGIRLSKTILEQYKFSETIEMELKKDCIVLKAKVSPRKGWAKTFKSMHDSGDDKLIIPFVLEDENFEEWK